MTHISERLLVQAHLTVKRPRVLSEQGGAEHRTTIVAELKAQSAVLVTHYYYGPVIQALAERTGGCISDSLGTARFDNQHPAQTMVVAGVRFIDETARILNSEKHVPMPTLEVACLLDLDCPVDEFSAFCDQHPKRTVVVYIDASAAAEARAGQVVTSSYAVEIVEHLMDNGEPTLWAPDQHLGRYVQHETEADMLLWDDACIVHGEFKAKQLEGMKTLYPDATILVHPESPESVVALADAMGSTSQLIKAAQTLLNKAFIVATDRGTFYKMQQLCPDKDFIEAPTAGNGIAYRSCAHCPRMAMNTFGQILVYLCEGSGEILVDPALVPRAVRPLKRMLDFTQAVCLHQARDV